MGGQRGFLHAARHCKLEMVNDIPLEIWRSENEERTGLLSNSDNGFNCRTKPGVRNNAHRGRILLVSSISLVLLVTFLTSAFDVWSGDDHDPAVQSPLRSTPPATVASKGHYYSTLKNENYYYYYSVRCAPVVVTCDSGYRYRTINGTCNNLNNPIWGSSVTPFVRLVDAHYSDGISKLRLSSNGKQLPSAREIQVQLFLNKQTKIPDKNNQLLMQWGQFIAHDVSNLAINTNVEDCCLYENKSAARVPKACEATIKIPTDDPVYSKYNKTCMRFTRAVTSANYNCPLQPSTFMNDASHYIDGSQIYGSNDYTMSILRSYNGGTLMSVVDDDQEFCPHSSAGTADVNRYFYNSGDSRANLNLGLALFHNMFLRFHNFVAFKLKSGQPWWSDEILYQESRRIVGAIIQHITYAQFLPIILGRDYTNDEVLGGDVKYEPTVNPSTSQEFSSGAFRVLHNIVPAQHRFVDSNYTTVQTVNVTDWINRPYLLQTRSNFDHLLRGLVYTGGRLNQPSYNQLISNFMFRPNDHHSIGVDLLSYDIQRGRDTGLPPYNKMRELCGLPVAESFDDLVDVIPSDDVRDLERLYSNVDDVDFLVGALLETPENDSLVGNTSRCVIRDFFYRSRVGDRFFYNNDKQPEKFSKEQLEVLKSISLDHVICATSSVDHLQKNIFTKVDNGWYSSMKWTCDEKYLIDFTPWEEDFYD